MQRHVQRGLGDRLTGARAAADRSVQTLMQAPAVGHRQPEHRWSQVATDGGGDRLERFVRPGGVRATLAPAGLALAICDTHEDVWRRTAGRPRRAGRELERLDHRQARREYVDALDGARFHSCGSQLA